MKTVLTIAGSDSGGGAGIQADLKTIMAHGMYGMSVVTALTAQNTRGVFGLEPVSPDFVERQLDAVLEDLFPEAVKIGMLPNAGVIEAVARKLKEFGVKNVVADPVLLSTSGRALCAGEAVETLCDRLFPLVDVLTPNLSEAYRLSGEPTEDKAGMERAAKVLQKTVRGAVLVKGGHLSDGSDDLFYDGKELVWFHGKRLENPNTHGTGCTLSSAIACGLAEGLCPKAAVKSAKAFLAGAIADGMNLGKGSGPLNHGYRLPEFSWGEAEF